MSVTVFGDRECGSQVRQNNAAAVESIGNILRSSLGPKGLDKMVVDDLGEVVVTNDGATILKHLEVEHPAGKMLVELASNLDKEVGDGTTSVTILTSELLRRGNKLVDMSVHPTGVIMGYRMAMREAVNFIEKEMSVGLSKSDTNLLMAVAGTTLASKYIGSECGFFEKICVEAILAIEQISEWGAVSYPVSSIKVVKQPGGSMKDSFLADGFVFEGSRASGEMRKSLTDVKVAIIDFALKAHRLQLGVSVQISDPQELEKAREAEKEIAKNRVSAILDAGANFIISTQGIDDTTMKYILARGAVACRRVPKDVVSKISQLTKAVVCRSLACLDGSESYPPNFVGSCHSINETLIGDREYFVLKGLPGSHAASIVLRGANDFIIEEIERSVHDALCALSKALTMGRCTPGGGAVEIATSIHLEKFAQTIGSRQQLAVTEFAESLLTIPKTLAYNAALDSHKILAALRFAVHQTANSQPPQWHSISLNDGNIVDPLKAGILEPLYSKIKAIRFATEAAIVILRVDEFIKVAPVPETKPDGSPY